MKPLLTTTGFILLLAICDPEPIEYDIDNTNCLSGRYGLNIKLSHEITVCNENGVMLVWYEGSRYDSLRNETIINLWNQLQ